MKYRYTITLNNLIDDEDDSDKFNEFSFLKDLEDFISDNGYTYYLSKNDYQIKIEDEYCMKLNKKENNK